MRDADLRRLFQKHLPKFHWQSIETWSTGQGVPDINYCYNSAEGWVEMKRVNGWSIKLDPEQIAWLERRARAGGRVFVAARRIQPPQTFCLFRGEAARTIISARETAVPAPLIYSVGPPGSWPWDQIAFHLTF